MATATTQAAWRSFGGDTTKTAYAGDMLMVAEFYIPYTQQTANTNVQVSSTNTAPLILPAGAEVAMVDVKPAVTGGTTPTLNLGLRVGAAGSNTATALLNATPAVSTAVQINLGSATAGSAIGGSVSTTQLQYVTGALTGTPTGGSLTGHLYYYIPNGGAATA